MNELLHTEMLPCPLPVQTMGSPALQNRANHARPRRRLFESEDHADL